MAVVSPHSLELLTEFAATSEGFCEDVVTTFEVHRDDIPAVMAVYQQCFPGRKSNSSSGTRDQVEKRGGGGRSYKKRRITAGCL